MGLLRQLINLNIRLSYRFDALFPSDYTVDGNYYYEKHFAPPYLRPHIRVYDIGGGKHPYISPAQKDALGITVVGLDIDAAELSAAPAGTYDDVIQADITAYRGPGDADLVICEALLEHVPDADAAFTALASILKPGGIAVIFVPSRNAVFARLNLALPEGFKRWLLYTFFPSTRTTGGFRSYYDRCTPREFAALAKKHGLRVIEQKVFFMSDYFAVCVPVHVLWRLWTVAFRAVAGDNAAESFCMAFCKDAVSS